MTYDSCKDNNVCKLSVSSYFYSFDFILQSTNIFESIICNHQHQVLQLVLEHDELCYEVIIIYVTITFLPDTHSEHGS